MNDTTRLRKPAADFASHRSIHHGQVVPSKFIEAAKRVQRANRKLADFERGFISKEGIKDREWYYQFNVLLRRI